MNLSKLQDGWKALLTFAVAVCTLIAGFLVLPQVGLDTEAWSNYGIVMVALLVGLWLVPMRLYGMRRYLRYWVTAAVLFSVAAGVTYLAYRMAIEHWTFPYPDDTSKSRVVAGKTLSEKAEKRRDETTGKKNDTDNQALYQWADGESIRVWPKDEERSARLNGIVCLYLFELLLLPSAMVTVVQASSCAAAVKHGGTD